MSLDIKRKITAIYPCTIETQKLENATNQGQCISFLGSQVESCGRCGAESDAPLLELISLSTPPCTALWAWDSIWVPLTAPSAEKKIFTITKGCKNVPVAHTEINPAQSPVIIGNVRARSKKRDRNNCGGTFSLLYLPSIQHNFLRNNLISKHITYEWDVSSSHTDVL